MRKHFAQRADISSTKQSSRHQKSEFARRRAERVLLRKAVFTA
jgi:hypothetical protein